MHRQSDSDLLPVCSVVDRYGHGWHDDIPGASANVPMGHGTHALPFAEKCPGRHSAQNVRLRASANLPMFSCPAEQISLRKNATGIHCFQRRSLAFAHWHADCRLETYTEFSYACIHM